MEKFRSKLKKAHNSEGKGEKGIIVEHALENEVFYEDKRCLDYLEKGSEDTFRLGDGFGA
jgi:hypothetical protein